MRAAWRLATLALLAGPWLGGPRSHPIVTVAQGDASRSPRAARTVDVSTDGRTIVFQSFVRLVAADADDAADIYTFDRATGRVTLDSVPPGDWAEHTSARTSGDGWFLVFESSRADSHGADIVLRDRRAATFRVVTDAAHRREPTGFSRTPSLSYDGRVLAFASTLTTLLPGPDANGAGEDVYVVALPAGAIARASVTSAGAQPPRGDSTLPSVSGDGRWLAFASTAPLVEPGASATAAKPFRQIYLRDLQAGRTRRVTRAANGGAPNGDSSVPSLSADGRYIAFASDASNLLDDDQNQAADVLLYDRETDALSWVSRGADGSSANGESLSPVISADGRFVVFQSDASNLVCARKCAEAAADINLLWDVFLFDRTNGQIVRMSEDDLGGWMAPSAGPAVDGAGRLVAFSSRHQVDAADRRDDFDLFVRALLPASTVTRKQP
jgi:Tol biopolymer transport system component